MSEGTLQDLPPHDQSSLVPRPAHEEQRCGDDPPGSPSESEPDWERWRGVVALPFKHRVLFTQEMEIQTSHLSRLKPHVVVDRRMVEGDDE